MKIGLASQIKPALQKMTAKLKPRLTLENGISVLAAGSLLGIAAAAFFPFKDPQGALSTLQKKPDLTEIRIGQERQVFGCGWGDTVRTAFTAKKKGEEVSGLVCKGYMQGPTVRYDRKI